MHVGRRLRQARLLAGLSQEELGEGIGVSFQAVQKYEHGENRLSASRLLRAARLLGRPASFFFEEIEESASTPAAPYPAFSRDEIELVRSYRQLASDDVRQQMLHVMKALGAVAARGAARGDKAAG